uniref:Uncharacterized protein n=1 Tax=Cucumis melo TaxID=3656 RepID=A0A9I9ECC2_CUCME
MKKYDMVMLMLCLSHTSSSYSIETFLGHFGHIRVPLKVLSFGKGIQSMHLS